MEKETAHASALFTRKKKLQQDYTALRADMYRRNLELNESNQMLSLLREIDDAVLDSQAKTEEVSQHIADSVAGLTTVSMAGVFVSQEDTDKLQLLGLGWDDSFAKRPNISKKNIKLSQETGWLASTKKTTVIDVNSLTEDQITKTLGVLSDRVKPLLDIGLRSLVVHKLVVRYRIVGLLVIGLGIPPETINVRQTELFGRISEAVGLALDNKMLFEENQTMLRQLQRTNSKLKQLDEIKDEFISMASHQLRTPLTSVKGYLSMVLEGDAGKIPPMQRKLLDQSFVSSQRMVYLIADLLNLSRLKTGKFIIDPVPTNLAKVLEDEVGQLKETAASRDLKLEYKKPANFPILMLDETKLRQVMMNFMDNSIHYTPAGGHITVELKETDKMIEYTVHDDGIGVPKHEQHHLFTKFYRAGNAKKARPDGIGLGLFMAKKVIIAQGGSIIFKSAEGKGSTFGFAFEKAKLQPPATP